MTIEDNPITNDEECAAAIAAIGALDRQLADIETQKSEAVAKASKTAEGKATPLLGDRAALAGKVTAWCTAERRRLLAGDAKTVEFSTGKVSWRMGRETVQLPSDKPSLAKIVGKLKELKLKRLIKVTETIGKQALLSATQAERVKLKAIRGITFVPAAEALIIEPTAAPLADRPSATGEGKSA